MRLILAILLAVCSTAISASDPLSDENAVLALTENISDTLAKGEFRQAIEMLKPYWPLPQAELQNLAYQTESQLSMVSSRFGKVIGAELIATESAGKSLIKHSLIVKYENHAIRWLIVYYKPKKYWQIDSVIWDDKVHELFN